MLCSLSVAPQAVPASGVAKKAEEEAAAVAKAATEVKVAAKTKKEEEAKAKTQAAAAKKVEQAAVAKAKKEVAAKAKEDAAAAKKSEEDGTAAAALAKAAPDDKTTNRRRASEACSLHDSLTQPIGSRRRQTPSQILAALNEREVAQAEEAQNVAAKLADKAKDFRVKQVVEERVETGGGGLLPATCGVCDGGGTRTRKLVKCRCVCMFGQLALLLVCICKLQHSDPPLCLCSHCFCMVHDEYSRILKHEESSNKGKRPLKLCSRGDAIIQCHTCEKNLHPVTKIRRTKKQASSKKKSQPKKRKQAGSSGSTTDVSSNTDDDFQEKPRRPTRRQKRPEEKGAMGKRNGAKTG